VHSFFGHHSPKDYGFGLFRILGVVLVPIDRQVPSQLNWATTVMLEESR